MRKKVREKMFNGKEERRELQIDREIDTNIAGKNERERNLDKQKDKSREMISTVRSIHQN